MSRWTHVRGAIEFTVSPYEERKNGCLSLPFPDEQMEVQIGSFPSNRNYFPMDVWIFSLPKAKPIFEKAVKLLPQGEVGFGFSLSQGKRDLCSCSSFLESKSIEATYRKKVCEFESTAKGHEVDWSFVKEKYKLSWVNEATQVLFSCRNDLRYCSGVELMSSLVQFLMELGKYGVDIEDGVLEWEDEYEPERLYAFRHSRLSHPSFSEFMVLDSKTNQRLAWLKHIEKFDKEKKEFCNEVEKSENWDSIINEHEEDE